MPFLTQREVINPILRLDLKRDSSELHSNVNGNVTDSSESKNDLCGHAPLPLVMLNYILHINHNVDIMYIYYFFITFSLGANFCLKIIGPVLVWGEGGGCIRYDSIYSCLVAKACPVLLQPHEL